MDRGIHMVRGNAFQRYAVEGIGKGMDRMMVRKQLIDAFQKEIFGQVAIRTKGKDPETETERITKSVIKETTKKWLGLIKMFEKYKETSGLLKPEDLTEGLDGAE